MALKGQEARSKQRKQKQGGRNEKKMVESQWYWYLFAAEKRLGGLSLMFIWQLKVSENPSQVQEIGITMNWCYTFCHPDWVLDIQTQ